MKKVLLLLLSLHTAFGAEYINVATHMPTNKIALTLDACGGATDQRILDYVVRNKIPTTIFVTSAWMKKNPQAINYMKDNAQYFQIENHGYAHKEAIQNKKGMYGLPTVNTQEGLAFEVETAAGDIHDHFGVTPTWYRTAGAMYDEPSLLWLTKHGWSIGGYTIAADAGATASKNTIVKNLSNAKGGDVILIHMNKPNSHVYAGLEKGLPLLKKKGFIFSFLE
jgi:peptidoglycan/xylan/chitin deacetylase (PgdA/CDA1 family)